MTMTDEELDREWKPSGRRPQSCVSCLLPLSRRRDCATRRNRHPLERTR